MNQGNSTNQSISDELGKIKDSFNDIQRLIANNEFVAKMDNNTITKFENLIHDKVKQLQEVFIEFVDNLDVSHMEILGQTCNDTNAMSDVLTSLHNETVYGGNGTFNELLDGGVSLTFS